MAIIEAPRHRNHKWIAGSLIAASLLIPARSRADGPDWPLMKGQSAVCGKVVSFKAASKQVVVDVKFQLVSDTQKQGYGWWNEKGSYVGKKLTIDLSHTSPKVSIGVKNSHGVTETIRLGTGKWADPAVGSFFTVYFSTPKGKETITATASTADAP